jgi:predicted nuclease of restriction endonuclease-like (RecB) superfamily
MSNLIPGKGYKTFLAEVINAVKTARNKAYQAVDRCTVDLYLSIGKQLHEKTVVTKWGDGVVEKLSLDLQREFPEMRGLSPRNLWDCKRLYVTYKDSQILREVLAETTWTNNLIILNKTKSLAEREFYLRSCISERWSSTELIRQFNNCLFEKWAGSDSGNKLIPHTTEKDPTAHFRDEYNLGFLGLKEPFAEKDLRKAIVHNLRDFFLEFGKHLSFIGEEYPVTVGDTDFRVDLLFFHRVLRCLVAVELKIGKFEPEYVGKMLFYLNALDEKLKLEHENPSVGLVLCKSKDDEVVRLAMSKSASSLRVATYEIIDQKLLERKIHSLPLLVKGK